MQLCKCLNCFLKTHNKQLNQYLFIFFTKKKNVLKNVLDRVGLTHKKLELGQKIITHFTMSTHISLYFIVKYIITLIFSFRDGNGAGRG